MLKLELPIVAISEHLVPITSIGLRDRGFAGLGLLVDNSEDYCMITRLSV